MGFVPKRKVYKLKFEGDELDGLIVKANSLTTGEFLDITERAEGASEDPKDNKSNRELFERFIPAVVEWNLEKEDGTPWPITVDTLLAQDFSFTMAIIHAWTDAIGGVSAPLAAGSTDGEQSLEGSIPMDVPSPSQPS